MRKIDVKLPEQKEKSYPIYIGQNLLDDVYELIQKHTSLVFVLLRTAFTLASSSLGLKGLIT